MPINPINPATILDVKLPPSPLEQQRGLYELQNARAAMQERQALLPLKIQQAQLEQQQMQRAQAAQDAIGRAVSSSGVINSDGSMNYDKFREQVANTPAAAQFPAMVEQFTKADEARAKLKEAKLTIQKAEADEMGGIAAGANAFDDPHDKAGALMTGISAGIQAGTIEPDAGHRHVSEMLGPDGQPDPARVNAKIQQLLAGSDAQQKLANERMTATARATTAQTGAKRLDVELPKIAAETTKIQQETTGQVPITPYQQGELNAANLRASISQGELGVAQGRLNVARQREARESAQAVGSNVDIKPGSREYRTAQDLANGTLTMTDFQRLYGRAQANAPLKSAIYDTARLMNPEFSPAQFELGYKMAGNPQIRRQIVAINSLSPLIDRVESLVSQVNPTDVPALNKLIQGAEFQLGGEKVADLRQLQRLLGDEAGVALGVGTGSDLKTKLGLNMVDPSLGPGAFKRTLDDLKLALESKRRNLSGPGMMGPYGAAAGAPAAPTTPAPVAAPTPTLRFNPATGKVEPIGR